jgi:phytoene/squalene synthetase
MTTALERHELAAERASREVIRTYSTSFGLASRLLRGRVEVDVVAVYGLVRLADEVVDGAAEEAGMPYRRRHEVLDDLEAQTLDALDTGYSTNPVVQAFAHTARRVGIRPDLVRPFFSSMRTDLDVQVHTPASFVDYVYGSAEVVGLMCLRCFLAADDARQDVDRVRLERGARALGAAYQKVNFLRDLGEDAHQRGRRYFPGLDPDRLDEVTRDLLVADIRTDLAQARAVVTELPPSSRTAVLAAHDLFAELARRIARTRPEEIVAGRVRVPDPVKAALVARAAIRARRGGR